MENISQTALEESTNKLNSYRLELLAITDEKEKLLKKANILADKVNTEKKIIDDIVFEMVKNKSGAVNGDLISIH